MAEKATVRTVMKADPVAVGPDAPLDEAIRLMMEQQGHGLPVVDENRRLLGMITEKDMLRLLYDGQGAHATVAELMTTQLRTFQADEDLAVICDCLVANHVRAVPILEGDRLVGLISRSDLMGVVLEAASERIQTN